MTVGNDGSLHEAPDDEREPAVSIDVDARAHLAQVARAPAPRRRSISARRPGSMLTSGSRTSAASFPRTRRAGPAIAAASRRRALVDHPPICTIALRGPPSPMSWNLWPSRFPASAARIAATTAGCAARAERAAQIDGVVVGRGRRAARPSPTAAARLQVVQKCSVIGEMMPKRRAGGRRASARRARRRK